jgi:1-acyl-sn-glycerol-3-phosphate acyltransferase
MRGIIAVLRPFAWWLCRVLFKIEFHGIENVPREGACIITPNHVTFADPVWITIPIRRRLHYMAWDRMFEIPVLGFVMRVFGAFPVSQEAADVSAQRVATSLLKRGEALVIFPEGGRTRTGKVMPFKLGAFRLALTHGALIVPVTISGARQIWPVGQILPHPGKLTITYHQPILVERVPEDISSAELKQRAGLLARQVRDMVISALAQDTSKPETTQAAGKRFS